MVAFAHVKGRLNATQAPIDLYLDPASISSIRGAPASPQCIVASDYNIFLIDMTVADFIDLIGGTVTEPSP